MFLILDMLLMMMMMMIVFMVYSGFMSLLDRKIMALTQNRMGPGLFLFGLCTPMFDGVKLILKFGLLMLNIELFYLFFIMMMSLFFNYSFYFIMPLTTMMLMNMNFNHFLMLSIHTMLLVVNTFLVGCFIINTCFVYLATMRTMLFSMMSEFTMLIMFMYLTNINFFAMHNFIMINMLNIILYNFLCFPLFMMLLMLLCLYLQNLMNIFEFAEAESELVAGTMTELSGVFFCIESLMEITHTMISMYLLITLLIGGFFMNYKLMICMICIMLMPKLLLCSLKMNNAILFLFFYVIMYLFLYLLIINMLKLLYIMNM